MRQGRGVSKIVKKLSVLNGWFPSRKYISAMAVVPYIPSC